MWNVYVIEDGGCERFNSKPYDTEQVAQLLDTIGDVAMVLLMRYDCSEGANHESDQETVRVDHCDP